MPFFGVLILFKHHTLFSIMYRPHFVNSILSLSFMLTLVFPLISLFVLFKSKIITDINLEKREERNIPIVITLCYYLVFYYFLRRIDELDTVIISGMFGGYLALIISLVITSYWKISLHTLGIASLTGLFLGAVQDKFLEQSSTILILFVLVGLMGTSRLILKQHTPLQVYAGGVLGFIIPYTFVLNGWYL